MSEARARPEQLGAFRPGVAAITATLTPRAWRAVTPVVELRSAYGRRVLALDPIGSVPFGGGKPASWLVSEPLVGWPGDGFAVELELCPMRGSSRPVLVSYAVAGAPPFVLFEQVGGGLSVEVGGETYTSGVHLDYAQWQRIAVAWAPGRLRLYKDRGAERVAAEAAGHEIGGLGAPVFETAVSGGALPAGGVLVVGQRQGLPGVVSDFAAGESYRGALAEVRVWRGAPDFTVRDPAEHDPALLARWRFSALGLELGEAVGTPRAVLGGIRPGELRDVSALRVVAGDGRAACATAPILAPGRRCVVALVAGVSALPGDARGRRDADTLGAGASALPGDTRDRRGADTHVPGPGAPADDEPVRRDADTLAAGPVVLLDGVAVPCARLDPLDVERDPRRGFAVGALDALHELRLEAADGALLAHYRGGGLPLQDHSGNGLDLDA